MLNEKNIINKQKVKKDNNNIKENDQRYLDKSTFYKCFINCCSKNYKNYKSCKEKFTINCQFSIFFFPLTIFLMFVLLQIHIYLFNIIFNIDYYMLIKEEYLKYLLTDIDDAQFEINSNEFKSQFQDTGNLLFFKIYFDELISLGLIDEDNVKIFPNISNLSENYYELALNLDGKSTLYDISSNLSKKYIDERNDSFSELMKVYYHFYYLISFEAFTIGTYINQTYFLAYQIDDNNKILGDEAYFNFPRVNDENLKNKIFSPGNDLISPKINNSKVEHTKLLNNSFYSENWFIKQDYDFRIIASDLFDMKMSFLHYNYNLYGTLKKSNIVSLQNIVNRKGKKYMINIIYYISQKTIRKDSFEYSIFILNNISELITNEKFSDNKTYVISQNEVTEIALSVLVNQYYKLAINDKNHNFFTYGLFYDNFNVHFLSEPSKFYTTIKGFNFDLRYFSTLYLYSKLFQKSTYSKNETESGIKMYLFNDKAQINDICSKFNFSLYKEYIKENKIDCWNNQNLFYYSKDESSIPNTNSFPHCICIPLYCIQGNNKNFNPNNIQFIEELILPDKCQIDLKYYMNDVEENNPKITKFNKKRFYFLGSDLFEDEYFKFTHIPFGFYDGLSCVVIGILENEPTNDIFDEFFKDINKILLVFVIILCIGVSILFFILIILIKVNIYKISNIIYEYIESQNQFLKKLEDKKRILIKEKNIFDDIKIDESIMGKQKDKSELNIIKYENLVNGYTNKSNNSEIKLNDLIDELFKIYCKFYKLSEEDLLKTFIARDESRSKFKINTLNNSNELFKLFSLIGTYVPKFLLEIDLDFNFFRKEKLLSNYKKYITKKSLNINNIEIVPTTSIIYELLSTEMISSFNDYGIIVNLNFNYLTNIDLYSKDKNNSIQNQIFKQIYKTKKNSKFVIEEIVKDNKNDSNIIKIICKKKNDIMEKIEQKFEQDDYLQLNKLESSFNSFLIITFYNYYKKIVFG